MNSDEKANFSNNEYGIKEGTKMMNKA